MKNVDLETKEKIYSEFLEFLKEELKFYNDMSDDIIPLKTKVVKFLSEQIKSFKKFPSDVKIDVVSAFYREEFNMIIKFEVEGNVVEVQKYLLGSE